MRCGCDGWVVGVVVGVGVVVMGVVRMGDAFIALGIYQDDPGKGRWKIPNT